MRVNCKAVLLAVGLIFFELPAAGNASTAIRCDNPEKWVQSRVCSNPEIMALVEAYLAAWQRIVGRSSWEAFEDYAEDDKTTGTHIEQLCWGFRNPTPPVSESDACLISFIHQEIDFLETKFLTHLPMGFGSIQARRISWVTPTPTGETSHLPFPGIKSYGFVVFPAFTEPSFRALLKMPEDIMSVADISRSLQIDFDILDLRPESLTFRYRYRQETFSGEMRTWETLKTLDLTGGGK
jgi:hypothetical protein